MNPRFKSIEPNDLADVHGGDDDEGSYEIEADPDPRKNNAFGGGDNFDFLRPYQAPGATAFEPPHLDQPDFGNGGWQPSAAQAYENEPPDLFHVQAAPTAAQAYENEPPDLFHVQAAPTAAQAYENEPPDLFHPQAAPTDSFTQHLLGESSAPSGGDSFVQHLLGQDHPQGDTGYTGDIHPAGSVQHFDDPQLEAIRHAYELTGGQHPFQANPEQQGALRTYLKTLDPETRQSVAHQFDLQRTGQVSEALDHLRDEVYVKGHVDIGKTRLELSSSLNGNWDFKTSSIPFTVAEASVYGLKGKVDVDVYAKASSGFGVQLSPKGSVGPFEAGGKVDFNSDHAPTIQGTFGVKRDADLGLKVLGLGFGAGVEYKGPKK